jgi:hypothetical protein
MPAAAIVLAALALTAVVGLIAGAVWGQSESPGSTPTGSSPTGSSSAGPAVTTAPGDTASPTGTGSSTSGPSDPATASAPSSAAAPPPGSAPSAPATTTTSADGWRLGSWKITNTGGSLGVDTTARNTATGTRSATLVLYVYVNGALIATTTAVVTDVPAGGTVPVHFGGTDSWAPGTKVLLLATA